MYNFFIQILLAKRKGYLKLCQIKFEPKNYFFSQNRVLKSFNGIQKRYLTYTIFIADIVKYDVIFYTKIKNKP